MAKDTQQKGTAMTKFYCDHSRQREAYVSIADDNGREIGALCLDCGSDQATHKLARMWAIRADLVREWQESVELAAGANNA